MHHEWVNLGRDDCYMIASNLLLTGHWHVAPVTWAKNKGL